MEEEKAGYNRAQSASEQIGGNDEIGKAIIYRLLVENVFKEWIACHDEEPDGRSSVEKHVHEVLVVIESDTIGNPWTVMVHFQDAFVALRAVMTTVRL